MCEREREDMNLFYLEEDPETCAQSHCNKHVPKMVVETAQLLCNVHHLLETKDVVKAESEGEGEKEKEKTKKAIPYKYSRSGHTKLAPMQWLLQSKTNYRWAVKLGLALSEVYTQRFGGKRHKTHAVLEWLRENEPENLEDIGFTRPLCAMPDEYKHPDGNPIESYRKYYVYDKHRFACWPDGMEPKWFTQGVEDLKAKGLYNKVAIAYPTKNQKASAAADGKIVAKRTKKRNLVKKEGTPLARAAARKRSSPSVTTKTKVPKL